MQQNNKTDETPENTASAVPTRVIEASFIGGGTVRIETTFLNTSTVTRLVILKPDSSTFFSAIVTDRSAIKAIRDVCDKWLEKTEGA